MKVAPINAPLHVPVLVKEIIQHLEPIDEKRFIVDCTVGTGGHSLAIAERLGPKGKLIGIDQDFHALAIAQQRLAQFKNRVQLIHGNFANLERLLRGMRPTYIDGIVMDLGVSTFQLRRPERGFSFWKDGPLDMRMNQHQELQASHVVNSYPEQELAEVLKSYGNELRAKEIAAAIVKERPLNTTRQLADIVYRTIPMDEWPDPDTKSKANSPAAQTFQAIRIVVNDEIGSLKQGMKSAVGLLSDGGRILIMTFQRIEHEVVQDFFDHCALNGYKRITYEPIRPSIEETKKNPKSRSARLNILERTEGPFH